MDAQMFQHFVKELISWKSDKITTVRPREQSGQINQARREELLRKVRGRLSSESQDEQGDAEEIRSESEEIEDDEFDGHTA